MTDKDTETTVRSIISRVSGFPTEEIHADVNIQEELLIDSLMQMEIVVRIEQTLGISMDEARLSCIETLGEFFDMVNDSVVDIPRE